MGYDDNTPLTGVTGGGLPAEIWRETMARVEEGLPVSPLPARTPAAAGRRSCRAAAEPGRRRRDRGADRGAERAQRAVRPQLSAADGRSRRAVGTLGRPTGQSMSVLPTVSCRSETANTVRHRGLTGLPSRIALSFPHRSTSAAPTPSRRAAEQHPATRAASPPPARPVRRAVTGARRHSHGDATAPASPPRRAPHAGARGAQRLPPAERHHPVAAAGALSGAARQNYALSFTQIGLMHLVFQVHRVAAAAGGRALHRPAADVPAVDRRHGREPRRPRCCSPSPHHYWAAAGRRGLRSASARRSSTPTRRGSPAPPRAGATASPSRCSRSAATPAPRSGRCSPPSSCCRSASRASPGSRCWRSSRWCCSGTSAPGRAPSTCASRAAGGRRPPALAAAAPAGDRASIAILALLIFSKYVYVASLTSYYTFFLIERFGVSVRDLAAAALRLPRRGRRRHLRRRPDRRPGRPQGGDLGLDPRRAAVHAGAAATPTSFWTVGAVGDHRPDHRLGVLGDPRLRPGSWCRAGSG